MSQLGEKRHFGQPADVGRLQPYLVRSVALWQPTSSSHFYRQKQPVSVIDETSRVPGGMPRGISPYDMAEKFRVLSANINKRRRSFF
jgi:hypothetical protein